MKPRRQTTHTSNLLCSFLHSVQRLLQHTAHSHHITLDTILTHLENQTFGLLHQVIYIGFIIECLSLNISSYTYQLTG